MDKTFFHEKKVEINRNKEKDSRRIAEAFRVEVDYIQFHDIHNNHIRHMRWNSLKTVAMDIAFLLGFDDTIEFLKECGFWVEWRDE